MLFGGSNYYPRGGWWDFRGEFVSVGAAKEHWAGLVNNDLQDYELGYPYEMQWAHIAQNGKIIWAYDYRDGWTEGDPYAD